MTRITQKETLTKHLWTDLNTPKEWYFGDAFALPFFY
jgi:hypothetical protein